MRRAGHDVGRRPLATLQRVLASPVARRVTLVWQRGFGSHDFSWTAALVIDVLHRRGAAS